MFVLLATALAAAAALRHSLTHGHTRWARTFSILLVVSLFSPLMFICGIYSRFSPLVSGKVEVATSLVSALGFLLLAILALVYAHIPEPASRAPS